MTAILKLLLLSDEKGRFSLIQQRQMKGSSVNGLQVNVLTQAYR